LGCIGYHGLTPGMGGALTRLLTRDHIKRQDYNSLATFIGARKVG
jgi:hypothetical protein